MNKLFSLIVCSFIFTTTAFTQQVEKITDLKLFENHEWVDYCVPLPLDELYELPQNTKAIYQFKGKKDAKYTLIIQGLMRQNTEIPFKTYYQNTLNNFKEITSTSVVEKVDSINNKFMMEATFENNHRTEKYLEICWLRKDDVVVLRINYPLKDSQIWDERKELIFKSNTLCN